MKVFTHYESISNNDGVRYRTLLQYGDSWNIIGSVVMMNPGSSSYKNQDSIKDSTTLENLKRFDDNELPWYEFSEDATMRHVGELFALYYKKQHRNELNGIIQIFNLFYIREANLEKAISKDKNLTTSNIPSIEYDLDHLVAPIYLGFGGLARNINYVERTKKFWQKAMDKGMNYLCPDFNKNSFTHPSYLMGRGKNRNISILTRKRFILGKYNVNEL
ncbi:MAG TPA: hypothetical protein PKZ15_09075 [Paludibacteraceae bacterium]|nr:hypothetical protein [Paludibacteraceae bacterium]